MFANYVSAAGSSSIITFGIFYLMQSLIAFQPGITIDEREPHVVTFIRVKKPEDPPIVEKKPIPRPTVEELPRTPPMTAQEDGHDRIPVPRSTPLPAGSARRGIDFSLSDGPLINIVRVQPGYPARAAQMGLEGYVVVQFDVAENGQTMHATAVESSHSIFESAALKAASRLRYKPKVVHGVPVATTGLRYRFTFEIEK